MEKYMKAQDVCKAFADYIWSPLPRTISYASSFVEKIPATDVVEVIRCKDCIYWRGENDLCKGIGIDFDADGYCSKGKRKDGGQEND